MNKYRSSTFRSHSSSLPSPVSDNLPTRISSEQVDRLHRHSLIDDKNHHGDVMQDDRLVKLINDIPFPNHRKEYSHRSNRTLSLLPISINNALIILIRLMILFIVVLMIRFTCYYAMGHIYSQPKTSGWEAIVNWLYQE